MKDKLIKIAGSSPHVRGAPDRFDLLSMSPGIIPACAGSTSDAGGGAL